MAWFTPARRAWIYNIVIAAGPLIVFYGLATGEEIALWLGVVGTVLGTGPASLARANVEKAPQ